MLSLITAATLLLAALATATPAPDGVDTANIKASDNICLKICEDAGFNGLCYDVCPNSGECVQMPLKPVSLRGEVSSIDISDNTSGCTFYSSLYCDGESFDIGVPGTSNLAGSGWNDRIQSGMCN